MNPHHEPHNISLSARGRSSFVAVAALLFTVATPMSALAVLRTCGPDAIANTQNVLCASGTCTAALVRVTTAIEVTSGGCEFDLGEPRPQLRARRSR